MARKRSGKRKGCRDKVVVVHPHTRSPRNGNAGKPRPRVRSYRRSRPC